MVKMITSNYEKLEFGWFCCSGSMSDIDSKIEQAMVSELSFVLVFLD